MSMVHCAFEKEEMNAETADPSNFVGNSVRVPAGTAHFEPAPRSMGFFEAVRALRSAELYGTPAPVLSDDVAARIKAVLRDSSVGGNVPLVSSLPDPYAIPGAKSEAAKPEAPVIEFPAAPKTTFRVVNSRVKKNVARSAAAGGR